MKKLKQEIGVMRSRLDSMEKQLVDFPSEEEGPTKSRNYRESEEAINAIPVDVKKPKKNRSMMVSILKRNHSK